MESEEPDYEVFDLTKVVNGSLLASYAIRSYSYDLFTGEQNDMESEKSDYEVLDLIQEDNGKPPISYDSRSGEQLNPTVIVNSYSLLNQVDRQHWLYFFFSFGGSSPDGCPGWYPRGEGWAVFLGDPFFPGLETSLFGGLAANSCKQQS